MSAATCRRSPTTGRADSDTGSAEDPTSHRIARTATYIGRIGALAVALGVGVALTGSPAVALAEPTATNSTTDSPPPADSAGSDDTAAVSPAGAEPDDSDSGSPSDVPNDSNDDDADSASGSPTRVTSTLPGGVTVSASGGAHTSEGPAGADEPADSTPAVVVVPPNPTENPTENPAENPTEGPTDSTRESKNDSRPAAVPASSPKSGGASISTYGGQSAAEELSSAPVAGASRSARSATADEVVAPAALIATNPQLLAPPPSNPIADPIALPGRVVAAVLGTFLSPFLAPAGAPSQPPLLWAVLGWVRREIQTTFFNRRPVLAAPTDVEQIDRVVTGVTVGSDPDGDEVTYTVAPASAAGGAVAIDQQGGFTYVAPQTWTGTTTFTDSFVVTISDARDGFHIHGLAGLLFGTGHTTTRVVSVTLAPTNLEPTATAVGSVTVPPSGVGSGSVRGADGTLAVYFRTGTGTSTDPYRTTLTVARPGQSNVTAEADGGATGGVLVLADGTAALTTLAGAGTAADPFRTLFTVMRPGEVTETLTTVGATPGLLLPNPDYTAMAGLNFIAVDGVVRAGAVRVVRVGEPPFVVAFDGQPQFSAPTVGADGTVVFTSTLLAEDGSTISDTVNVIPAGSSALTRYTFSADGPERPTGDPAVGGDGTVVFATTSGSGAAGDPVQTTVTILSPTRDPLTRTIIGSFSGVQIGVDGTIAYTTETGAGASAETTVTVLRPGRNAVVSTTPGRLYTTLLAADGTVAYQTYLGSGSPVDPYQLTMTALHPDDEPSVATATANYLLFPAIGAGGTVVLDALTGPSANGWRHEFVVLRPGAAPVSIVTDKPGSTVGVGPDGTVAVTTSSGSGTVADPLRTDIAVLGGGQGAPSSLTAVGSKLYPATIDTDGTVVITTADGPAGVVTVIRPGQPAVTYTATGGPRLEALIDSDGVIYQVLATDGSMNTALIVIEPSGESKTLSFAGSYNGLRVRDGGGAYLVTSVTDSAASTRTYTTYDVSLAPSTV